MNRNAPAFPIQYDPYIDHPTHGRIHRAAVGEEVSPGLTRREWFTGMAMTCYDLDGYIDTGGVREGRPTWEGMARDVVAIADAILAELEKEQVP